MVNNIIQYYAYLLYLSASSSIIIFCRPLGRVTFFCANILILFRTTSIPLKNIKNIFKFIQIICKGFIWHIVFCLDTTCHLTHSVLKQHLSRMDPVKPLQGKECLLFFQSLVDPKKREIVVVINQCVSHLTFLVVHGEVFPAL